MEKIRLKNGNTYEIEGGATEHSCIMTFDSMIKAAPVIEDFTAENMETVEFLTEAGEVCGVYENKELINAEVFEKDGKHHVVFNMQDVVSTSDEILSILLGGASV